MKLALVGCGGIASATAAAAAMNDKVTIAACCDANEDLARLFASDRQIPRVYPNFDALISDETLDAVYLATPHFLHHPMALAAFKRGLHVWCEKPIAVSVDQAQEMVAQAAAAGVKLGVNYQYRYNDACYKMAAAAREGALGEIYYARCHVPYHREPVYYAGWHALKNEAGGGTLLTVGSHMLDAVLWACASAPRKAAGLIAQRKFKHIEVEDLAMGVLELETGALIEICSSMVTTPERRPGIELYGSLDSVFFPPSPEVQDAYLVDLARSLEGFRAWIEEDQPYRIPGEEAIPALAAVEMIYRASESA